MIPIIYLLKDYVQTTGKIIILLKLPILVGLPSAIQPFSQPLKLNFLRSFISIILIKNEEISQIISEYTKQRIEKQLFFKGSGSLHG